MARSTSSVVWIVVFVVLAILGVLAAVFGPRLFREGRAFVAPIAELAGAEKAMDALDEDFPFEPPTDGLVREERLVVFLDAWDTLRLRYTEWRDLVNELEGRQAKSWQQAKDALAATRDVHRAQQEVLRARGLSPAELVWIEDAVLSWWRQVEAQLSDADRPAVVAELRRAREDDLRFVDDLERRHGHTEALQAVKRHLEGRLAAVDSSPVPKVANTPAESQELFWRHRDRIALIEGATHNPLHEMIRERGGVRIEVEDDGRPSFLNGPEGSEEN